MCVYVCMSVPVCVREGAHLRVCMPVCLHACVPACLCACMPVCLHVCLCVCAPMSGGTGAEGTCVLQAHAHTYAYH